MKRSFTAMHFITAKQLSGILGIPEGTLRYWRNVGLGPAWHKLEGSIRYASEDVEAYVAASRRVRPTPAAPGPTRVLRLTRRSPVPRPLPAVARPDSTTRLPRVARSLPRRPSAPRAFPLPRSFPVLFIP